MIEISYASAAAAVTLLWCAARIASALLRRRVLWRREAQLLLLYVCLLVVLRITFFPFAKVDGKIQPLIFDRALAYPFRINLVPFVHLLDYPQARDAVLNIVGNTTMFIPIGVILPLLFKRLDTPAKALLAGVCFSLCIELLQLPFYQRATDIDDLLLNSLGYAAGYLLYRTIRSHRR